MTVDALGALNVTKVPRVKPTPLPRPSSFPLAGNATGATNNALFPARYLYPRNDTWAPKHVVLTNQHMATKRPQKPPLASGMALLTQRSSAGSPLRWEENEKVTRVAARAEQHQHRQQLQFMQQHQQHPQQPGVNDPGRDPAPLMGNMRGMRVPRIMGLSFDVILSRLQGNSLMSVMSKIHDTLGGAVCIHRKKPKHPCLLQRNRAPLHPGTILKREPHSNYLSSSRRRPPIPATGYTVVARLSPQKSASLEDVLAEQEAMKREVSSLCEMMEERRREMEKEAGGFEATALHLEEETLDDVAVENSAKSDAEAQAAAGAEAQGQAEAEEQERRREDLDIGRPLKMIKAEDDGKHEIARGLGMVGVTAASVAVPGKAHTVVAARLLATPRAVGVLTSSRRVPTRWICPLLDLWVPRRLKDKDKDN
ncbi:hypothetical protein BDZ97DRAFT_1920665 [Flammula alnicola]|nr:hypothetical protein BDZ97DRAFT_1920665 [Flammula alnicola]